MPPISKDEDGIPQYVRARLTVLTLLFDKLEPTLLSEICICYLCLKSSNTITNVYLTIFGTLAVHCKLLGFIDLQGLSKLSLIINFDQNRSHYDTEIQTSYREKRLPLKEVCPLEIVALKQKFILASLPFYVLLNT